MALLIMILRKMIKNKWLELSLLFGLVLTVALASSMPIYTNAILQRMLSQELQNLQSDTGQYPGTYWLSADNPAAEGGKAPPDEGFFATDDYLSQKASGRFGLPVQQFVRERATAVYSFLPSDTERMDVNKIRWANFAAISDVEKHIALKDGRLPKKEPVDGVYEALVVPDALTELNLVLGNVFAVKDDKVKSEIRVKPVGVIEPSDYTDLFWYNSTVSYKSSFLIDLDLFDKSFTKGNELTVESSYWYFALDYTRMTLSSAKDFLAENGRIAAHMNGQYDTHSKNAPALRTLGVYKEKEAKLKILLLSLNVPVMLMLGFYLYMVANLITERQKTEIAVLRSRGASRLQIVLGYTIEGLVLGVIAFFAGPYVGVMITKVLGASSGFLEFVQRAKLHAEVGREAFEYALIAIVLSLAMTLLPVLLATRFSIVAHKQQLARIRKQSFWHKYYIDFLLIAISLYGLQSYETRMSKLLSIGANTADMSVDPLLFLIPAFFVLGLGLCLLRLYPWFIRLIYLIGRRWWPPSLYYTLIQVGRTSASYKFIMVFMIITIATGIFSASANRTINKNVADKIDYRIGADIAMTIRWESDAPPILLSGGAAGADGDTAEETASSNNGAPRKTQYTEPSFLPFTQMPEVEHAAKVFVKKDASYYAPARGNDGDASKLQERGKVELMGIDTYEFGMTAWLRDGLLDYSFNSYLNLLASEPTAVLISRSMAIQHGLNTGDLIQIGWYGADTAEFIVYGIVDYWPTWNPGAGGAPQPSADDGGSAKPAMPSLVIGNLSYIQNSVSLEPYEVWLKLKEGSSSEDVYQAVTDKGYDITSLADANQERIRAVNDPFQLAINGVMTLDFLISIVITFVGFLLYWVLSLFARTLQFGILRAMGISIFQLIGMLIAEQLLISGAAILLGVLNGNLTSRLFVRLFEMSFDKRTQILPFEVTFNPSDQVGLYVIVTIMMVLGIGILGFTVSRIRIHQALKLGED
ncbi:ABC transporter permease [Paenibacillus arenilitoris]|uniref:ABC transporter permease n=1 Tax=Paenibacillus arenilitoris TaxID=2772299 RepID=A0A927CKP0_9BACL|nr:ABC transporter permease [Paenibacillus arenilitoris]MBD2868522.1 ABC transporter permease [Paenibacillus arenilitoris]